MLAFEEQGKEATARTLYLRSIEYVVNRFGVPSEVKPGQGSIKGVWRSESAVLFVTLIHGYVTQVEPVIR